MNPAKFAPFDNGMAGYHDMARESLQAFAERCRRSVCRRVDTARHEPRAKPRNGHDVGATRLGSESGVPVRVAREGRMHKTVDAGWRRSHSARLCGLMVSATLIWGLVAVAPRAAADAGEDQFLSELLTGEMAHPPLRSIWGISE